MLLSGQRSQVDLVIIGHLAYNEDRTPTGTRVSRGGAAYYCAVGASVGAPNHTGIVAAAGPDFSLAPLKERGIDVNGVTVSDVDATARFVITQRADGTRTFEAQWGLANRLELAHFPAAYLTTRHVHLATAPPAQQLAWMRRFHNQPLRPRLSVDTFEHFVRAFPQQSRMATAMADMVFVNEEEAGLLGLSEDDLRGKIVVLKRGSRGASCIVDGVSVDVPAPRVDAVDTTGAGDILAGAFLALLGRGVALDGALAEAVAIASASVAEFGVDHERVTQMIGSQGHGSRAIDVPLLGRASA